MLTSFMITYKTLFLKSFLAIKSNKPNAACNYVDISQKLCNDILKMGDQPYQHQIRALTHMCNAKNDYQNLSICIVHLMEFFVQDHHAWFDPKSACVCYRVSLQLPYCSFFTFFSNFFSNYLYSRFLSSFQIRLIHVVRCRSSSLIGSMCSYSSHLVS